MEKHKKSQSKQLSQEKKKRKKTAFSHHCSICNKTFPYKSYLDRHMSCVHAPNLDKSNFNKSLDQKNLELENKIIEEEINIMDSENQPKKQKMEEQIETWDFEHSVDAVNVIEEPNDQSHLTAEQISFIPDDTKKRSRKQNIEERSTF